MSSRPGHGNEGCLTLPPGDLPACVDALRKLGLEEYLWCAPEDGFLALKPELLNRLAPAYDTTGLCSTLQFDTQASELDLQREIWLALLATPWPQHFPSYAELAAAVRMRANIVHAARKTALAFHTHVAERPAGLWTYSRETSFTVRPGCSLIEALERATQPEVSGQLYDFSCYRATEYVILLAMAKEAREHNPALFARMQLQSERNAVMSGQFHEVFLSELGSNEVPLPPAYYVPGDRVWFRNPDAVSSDVTGFEGSWVFYLGQGLFANFWKRDQPFTLLSKCVEIYHWRHGTYLDAAGELRMDESKVAEQVALTLADPVASAAVFEQMMRWRDLAGQYLEGGCIDRTRESPRWICAGTADIRLPDA